MGNQTRSPILIVEDDREYRVFLRKALDEITNNVEEATDGAAAISKIDQRLYDVVLLDLQLPKLSGLEVLKHLRENSPSTLAVVLTGSRDVNSAVEAMKKGAYDYLTKPIQAEELLLNIHRALERKSLQSSLTAAERALGLVGGGDVIVGESELWRALLQTAHKFAGSEAPVLIEGETGSGKGVIARYIHRGSARRDKSMVELDCGTIPDSLIESELFGHVKGAFTGATTLKEGVVELAQGGTLFLDEVGNLDLKAQQALLTFIDTRSFRRIGDTSTRKVDVRIIAATNKDLEKEFGRGTFREDLWYRLNVLRLYVPPLRKRKEDILPLANHFLRQYSRGRVRNHLSEEVSEALENYSWPGNVRELLSALQRAIAVSEDGEIRLENLGIGHSPLAGGAHGSAIMSAPLSLGEVERKHIVTVLSSSNWNISRAAKILQIGRNTLYQKMREHQIEAPSKNNARNPSL